MNYYLKIIVINITNSLICRQDYFYFKVELSILKVGLCYSINYKLLVRWGLHNGITLVQRQTDSNNRLMIKVSIWYERVIWDLVKIDQFDSFNRLITLYVIPLSGTYCICFLEIVN
jgi:hypothetical protein